MQRSTAETVGLATAAADSFLYQMPNRSLKITTDSERKKNQTSQEMNRCCPRAETEGWAKAAGPKLRGALSWPLKMGVSYRASGKGFSSITYLVSLLQECDLDLQTPRGWRATDML